MNMSYALSAGGVTTKVLRQRRAPTTWVLKNALRLGYIWGLLTTFAARIFTKITGIPTIVSNLRVRLIHNGLSTDYGVVSRRVVTTAGVTWLTDCWDGTYEPETMKYHGCGTGTGAEAVGDTALGTESTTALNPDSTRATGTLVGAAGVLTTVATLTFDGSAAITEHGLFNQAATGGGTLWDRSLFSAINVVSGDSIQFTYAVTFSAGG